VERTRGTLLEAGGDSTSCLAFCLSVEVNSSNARRRVQFVSPERVSLHLDRAAVTVLIWTSARPFARWLPTAAKLQEVPNIAVTTRARGVMASVLSGG